MKLNDILTETIIVDEGWWNSNAAKENPHTEKRPAQSTNNRINSLAYRFSQRAKVKGVDYNEAYNSFLGRLKTIKDIPEQSEAKLKYIFNMRWKELHKNTPTQASDPETFPGAAPTGRR